MLTKRIAKLVSLIPSVDTLCDVGCDHGYVGIEALKLGRAKRVAFVDVSKPSLMKARLNCPQQYLDSATFVCQDGIKDIDADCAVVAGMGGLEIISILNNAKSLPHVVVLQPMRNQRDVRSYVSGKYEILVDETFYDSKYYDIIVAELSHNPTKLTDKELEYGKTNLASPSTDFVSYLNYQLRKIASYPIFNSDDKLQAKADELDKMIAQYCATGTFSSDDTLDD